jgi:hypothetical protein
MNSLKDINVPLLWAALVLDAALLWGVLAPQSGAPADLELLKTATGRFGVAALVPVVVMLLNSLVPPETKSVWIFWRLREVLPGHRAFSEYASRDPRVSIQALTLKLGVLPQAAAEQNRLWYQLYKKAENQPAIAAAHRQYLLFRDLASLSLLLALVTSVPLIFIHSLEAGVWVVTILGLQYVASVIAARNHSIALITNVLAHASN